MAYKNLNLIEQLLNSNGFEKIDDYLYRKETSLQICYSDEEQNFYKLFIIYAIDARSTEFIIFYLMLTNFILTVPVEITRKIRRDIIMDFTKFDPCKDSPSDVIKIKIHAVDDVESLMEVLNNKMRHKIRIINAYSNKRKGRM